MCAVADLHLIIEPTNEWRAGRLVSVGLPSCGARQWPTLKTGRAGV
jgi:hypothetical protein